MTDEQAHDDDDDRAFEQGQGQTQDLSPTAKAGSAHASSTANEVTTTPIDRRWFSGDAPDDFGDSRAAAYGRALAALHDNSAITRAEAINFVRSNIARLADSDSVAVVEHLAGQALMAEGLALLFAKKTAEMTQPDLAAKMAKICLNAQTTFARTMLVIAELRARRPKVIFDGEEEA